MPTDLPTILTKWRTDGRQPFKGSERRGSRRGLWRYWNQSPLCMSRPLPEGVAQLQMRLSASSHLFCGPSACIHLTRIKVACLPEANILHELSMEDVMATHSFLPQLWREDQHPLRTVLPSFRACSAKIVYFSVVSASFCTAAFRSSRVCGQIPVLSWQMVLPSRPLRSSCKQPQRLRVSS